jgi:site-specific recombinase XerD
LRVSEAVTLDVRDVDLERRRLTIVGKGEKRRVVPVPENVAQDLRFLVEKRGAGPVLQRQQTSPRGHGEHDPLTVRQAQRILADAAERAER